MPKKLPPKAKDLTPEALTETRAILQDVSLLIGRYQGRLEDLMTMNKSQALKIHRLEKDIQNLKAVLSEHM